MARARPALSSFAASSVSSTATRAPGPSSGFMKSMLIASSSKAWCGWSYDTTERVSLNHPSSPLPMPSAATISTIEVHICEPLVRAAGRRLRSEVLLHKRPHLLPAVERLLDAVSRPVVIEEAVAGAVIAVELIVLAVFLQLGLVLADLLRGRGAVLVAEQPEQRAGQLLRVLDRRDRLFRVQFLLAHHDAPAPQLAGRVNA